MSDNNLAKDNGALASSGKDTDDTDDDELDEEE
jgi:hypothetical protein